MATILFLLFEKRLNYNNHVLVEFHIFMSLHSLIQLGREFGTTIFTLLHEYFYGFIFSNKYVRNTWKNLCQELGKQFKKTLRSGSGAPDEPTSSWPYFQSMLFLTDQFLPRKSSGNLASKDNNYDVMSDLSDDEEQTTDPKSQGDVNIYNEFEPFNETPSATEVLPTPFQ